MTAFSISVLRFDSKSDERIQRAWGRIQQLLGGDASVTYAPHVSLIPTDVQDQAELTRRIRNLVSAQPAFDITFSHLGLFPGACFSLALLQLTLCWRFIDDALSFLLQGHRRLGLICTSQGVGFPTAHWLWEYEMS